MKLLEDFDEEAFAKKLESGQEMLAVRLIPLALALGVLFFGIVVLALQFAFERPDIGRPIDTAFVRLLSMVHGMFFVLAVAAGTLIFKNKLSPAKIEACLAKTMHVRYGPDIDDPSSKFLMLYRLASIIRLALLEGAALFGLVICLLCVLGGQLDQQPLYGLNALSAVFMILHVVFTLPSKRRLMDLLRRKKENARLGLV